MWRERALIENRGVIPASAETVREGGCGGTGWAWFMSHKSRGGADPGSFRDLNGRMWRLAGPIILANSSTPLLGAVDTAVMGHLPDPRYLGAIAIGALIFSFLYWGLGFLRMGTTGLTAQAFGAWRAAPNAREARGIGAVFARASLLALGLGAAVLLLQWPIGLVALPLFGAEPAVETLAGDYYRIRIWSAPASLMNFVVLGWLLGTQRATTALLVQVVLNLVNAGLDVLFVVGFGWGVRGVAAGTLIAEYTAATLGVLLVVRVLRRELGLSLRELVTRGLLFHMPALRRLLAVNLDIFIRTVCLLAVFGVFTATGAQFGTTILAANAVLMNFMLFMSYGLDGFAFAAEALVGAEKGARNPAGFRRVVQVTTIWAFLAAAFYAAVYGIFGTGLIALLTDIAAVRETAGAYLPWLVAIPLVAVWSFQLDGIFIGLTRTREMRNSMVVSLGVFLACLAVTRDLYGNHGLWAAFVLFMAFRALALGRYYPRLEQEFAAPGAATGS